MMKELILGGARSGKSALAQQRALASSKHVVFIATATAGDAEMAARIERHRRERPVDWAVVEEPLALAEVMRAHASPHHCLLVDCLTLWLSNLLLADDKRLEQERSALLSLLPELPGEIIFVSNEVGMGIIPMGELNRRFCDEAGRLHQTLAQCCERVTLVAAGLPLMLKQP